MAAERSRIAWTLAMTLVTGLIAALVAGGGARLTAAQTASPVATAGVPCTELFGIVDDSSACFLFIHAVPDTGPVDVYINGTLALPAIEFGILGDFFEVPSGQHQILVTVSGGDPAAPLIDESVSFAPGVAYEVAAVGPGGSAQLLAQPVNTTVIPDDQARLRVIHASPDAPAVDLALAGGEALVADLEFLETSEPLTIAPGTYDLVIRPSDGGEPFAPLGGTVLAPNVTYSFYVIGQVADGTIGGFVVPVSIPAAAATPAATPVP